MVYQEVRGEPDTASGQTAFRAGLKPLPSAERVLSSGNGDGVPSPRDFAFAMQVLGARRKVDLPNTHDSTTSRRVVPLKESSDEKRRRVPVAQERERQPVDYARTPVHDAITAELEQRPPDWFTIIRRLTEHPYNHEISNIHGRLAELYVDQVIKTLAKADQFRDVIVINPLDNIVRGGFSFQRERRGGLVALDQGEGQQSELDNFFLVRRGVKVPTLVEVKAVSGDFGKKDIERFLERTHLRRRVRAVESAYGTRAAVMLVTTQAGAESGSPALEEFKANGGYVVVMKPTADEFRTYAKRIHYAKDGQIKLPAAG